MAKGKELSTDTSESEVEVDEIPVDIDTFMSMDGISSTWVNGLAVWLANKGSSSARPLSEWRSLLKKYQSLR